MWVVQEDEDLDWWNTSCQSTVCVFTYTSKHHIHYCISRSNKFVQVSLHFVFPFGSLFMLLNAFNPFYESSDDCIWHLLWRPSKSCRDVWTRNYQEWRSPCTKNDPMSLPYIWLKFRRKHFLKNTICSSHIMTGMKADYAILNYSNYLNYWFHDEQYYGNVALSCWNGMTVMLNLAIDPYCKICIQILFIWLVKFHFTYSRPVIHKLCESVLNLRNEFTVAYFVKRPLTIIL